MVFYANLYQSVKMTNVALCTYLNFHERIGTMILIKQQILSLNEREGV